MNSHKTLMNSHKIIHEKVEDGGKNIKEKSFKIEVKYNYGIIYLNKNVKIVEETVHEFHSSFYWI